jgi:hypothetical protein
MSWNPIDTPIDSIVVAGLPSPGICKLTPLGAPQNWDERAGYGLSGSTLIFTGVKLAQFTAKITLLTRTDWELYHQWRRVIAKPPPNQRAKVLDFWHPFAEMQGVKSVVVLDERTPDEADENGTWIAEIDFKQWRKPKITLAKPDGSTSKPTDPAEIAIANLTGIVDNGGVGSVSQALAPMFSAGQLQGLAK